MEDEQVYWLAWSLVPGVGAAKIQRLLAHFGQLSIAWKARPDEWRDAGLEQRITISALKTRSEIDLEKEVARLERLGVHMLTLNDDGYPGLLKHVTGAPPILYVKGALTEADDWAVSIVGTRNATSYGRQVAEQLAGDLARANVTVVSGLARGIDTFAHQATVDAGGRTIAVLAHGLDIVYPPENGRLAGVIAERGALVSELPLGRKPDAPNFPARNRIISGLSLGVVVVEAPDSSGALITAEAATEQGRDVFAVPGNIYQKSSMGTNKLIKDGACLVLSVADILDTLNLGMVPQHLEVAKALPDNPTEEALLRLLSHDPCHIDDIGRISGLPIHVVSSTLTMMELKGMVREVSGKQYISLR